MNAREQLSVTRGGSPGRGWYRRVLEVVAGLGAQLGRGAVRTRSPEADESLLRAAAFAEAGYFPGLRQRLGSERRVRDALLSAVAFAEAGERDAALELVGEASRERTSARRGAAPAGKSTLAPAPEPAVPHRG